MPWIERIQLLTVVNWGDVPSWLSSVASLLALLFAAIAVVAAQRTFRIESERDRIDAQARRAQETVDRQRQAAMVSAWWGQHPASGQSGVFVRNASHTPVYQSHVTIGERADPDRLTKLRLAVVPPSDAPAFHPVAGTTEDRRVAVTFSDAMGVRWCRDRYGRLAGLAPHLTIWGVERMESVLQRFTADLAAEFGVTVNCHTTDWSTRLATYVRAAANGSIADVLDAPHDWIATLVAHDVIEPVVLTNAQLDLFRPWTVQAVTYEDRLYGIPLTTQVPVLLRNLDLAPEPPATFEDLLATGQALVNVGRSRQAFAVQTELFHLSTLFTSSDGEPFVLRPGSAWDPADPLRAEATATAALARLRALGEQGARALRRNLDEITARQLFLTGATPFLIGLSEDLSDARQAGLRCAVTPVPGQNGWARPRPLLSVRSFLLTRHGANHMVARDLVADYLTRADVARRLAHDLALPSCLRTPCVTDSDIEALRGHPDQATPLEADRPAINRVVHGAQVAAIGGAEPQRTARIMYAALSRIPRPPAT